MSRSHSLFICPICQSPMHMANKTWHCLGVPVETGECKQHTFDVAKQGYINLLPVQYKKSKHPGDSEQSILARQHFLQQGYYEVLAKGLVEFASSQFTALENPQRPIWLDVGCGEGYYTEQFLSLAPRHLIAMDISKPAVLATAKRLKNHAISDTVETTCMVATASQTPLADGSVNFISSIFSPILPQEFARLLNKDGSVLIAKPLPHHLIELRQALFDTVQDHDSDKFIEQMSSCFTLTAQQEIHSDISVTPEALAYLMTMTPYAYRASPTKREALLERVKTLGEMAIKTAFVLYWFIKN